MLGLPQPWEEGVLAIVCLLHLSLWTTVNSCSSHYMGGQN